MKPFGFQDLLAATGAREGRSGASEPLQGVSTDTRTLAPGNLYVALTGPNHDGNAYARQALERGAAALLLQDTPDLKLPRGRVPVALSENPRRALSTLAAWHRSRLDIPVVGITGSCGKTTTKNMLAHLLGGQREVVASPASYNNDIGVPHTLFLADDACETLVVEMGTNAPGEIEDLCRTAQPTSGIVTNVGASHLAGLGSERGVALEKGALPAAIGPDGFVVLNADCRWTELLRSGAKARVITFGVDCPADLRAEDIWFHDNETTFRLTGPLFGGQREVTLPLLGGHMVQNLLAALAACAGLGANLEEALSRVEHLQDGSRRMQRLSIGGLTVIDDSYNSNPGSARAGVRVLAGVRGYGRRVLVLGEMHELGEAAPAEHRALGALAAEKGMDLVLTVGEQALDVAAGARMSGMESRAVRHFPSVKEACDAVGDLLMDGDVVLVKGSRATRLERIVERIKTEYGTPAESQTQAGPQDEQVDRPAEVQRG